MLSLLCNLPVALTALLSLGPGGHENGSLLSFLGTGQNERVVFFPTLANEIPLPTNNDDGTAPDSLQPQTTPSSHYWNVSIHGWIFEPKEQSLKRALLISLLMKLLDIPKDNQKSAMTFQKRIRPFVVDNQPRKRVLIEIGGKLYRMPLSQKNGHFHTTLKLSTHQLAKDIGDDGTHEHGTGYVLPYKAKGEDKRIFQGHIHLVPSRGLSIISDIDDTIKMTNAFQGKQQLLAHTFLKEFQPVEGMAELYQHWQNYCLDTTNTNNDNTTTTRFHYVSNSVFQLYEDLEDFRVRANFPPATFHLKTIRPKKVLDTVDILTADPLDTKRVHIESIIKRFPFRKFVLVGDSGDKDPEVYAGIARDYPNQVKAIFIRNVNNNTHPGRFKEVSVHTQWAFFDHPEELLQYTTLLFGGLTVREHSY